jgi:hypothetical protein
MRFLCSAQASDCWVCLCSPSSTPPASRALARSASVIEFHHVFPASSSVIFQQEYTKSPTGFSPNPYDCRRFSDSAAPKTNIRLDGDFGGPMPTGLKDYQQPSSGYVAKPSEKTIQTIGTGLSSPSSLSCRAKVTTRLGGLNEALPLWGFWYSCWSLTSDELRKVERQGSRRRRSLSQSLTRLSVPLLPKPAVTAISAGTLTSIAEGRRPHDRQIALRPAHTRAARPRICGGIGRPS